MNKINPLMYFELRNGLLVTYHKEKDNYCIETSKNGRTNIPKNDFLYLTPVQISKRKFYEKLNLFYENVKDTWFHNGIRYKNEPNFEGYFDERISTQPKHNIAGVRNCILVYHHGSLKYAYQFSKEKVLLFNFRTHKFESRTSIRNCAPIQNTSTKQII